MQLTFVYWSVFCNLAELISFNCLCVCVSVWSLWFSIYKILSSANRNSFTPSLLFWLSFISFPFLMAVTRTSITMTDRNGKNGHLFLTPDHIGKAFSLTSLNVMQSLILLFNKYLLSNCLCQALCYTLGISWCFYIGGGVRLWEGVIKVGREITHK